MFREGKADVFFDEPQPMSLWNLIFQPEVVEQPFRTIVLPHHDEHASVNEQSVARIVSLYHRSAATPLADHGDFFNTHSPLHQLRNCRVEMDGRRNCPQTP